MASKIKKLINKSIKSKTLIQDAICYMLMKMHYANKYTASLMTLDRTFYKLDKKYKKYLSEINFNDNAKMEKSDYVWFCWFQGIDKAPELVQKCFESVKKNFKNKKVILITNENFSQYVKIPQYIIEKREKRNYYKYTFF